jgi:hypothetical protein
LRLSISSSAGRLGLQEAHLALSRIEGGPSMQYALLIYQQESVLGPDQGSPALNEIVAKHMAFSRELNLVRDFNSLARKQLCRELREAESGLSVK